MLKRFSLFSRGIFFLANSLLLVEIKGEKNIFDSAKNAWEKDVIDPVLNENIPVFGTGGYCNRPFDLNLATWAKQGQTLVGCGRGLIGGTRLFNFTICSHCCFTELLIQEVVLQNFYRPFNTTYDIFIYENVFFCIVAHFVKEVVCICVVNCSV